MSWGKQFYDIKFNYLCVFLIKTGRHFTSPETFMAEHEEKGRSRWKSRYHFEFLYWCKILYLIQ